VLVSSRCRERECIERAGGCAEVLLGQVQIDCRLLKVAMTEQHLDGAQVSAGFQKMGRKTMSQSMRMNVPVLESGAASRGPAHIPDRLVGDRLLHSTMAAAAREQVYVRSFGAPILAQSIEQPGAEHDVAILASFSALDMDNHAPAVDVAELECRRLRPAGSGGVERHQHGALKGCSGGID